MLITLILTHVVQNMFLHKSNWILYIPHPHLSPHFCYALQVCNQKILIHSVSLINVSFISRIHLKPGSPCECSSPFKSLKWRLFSAITLCRAGRNYETQNFPLCFHCHHQTIFLSFLEAGWRWRELGVGLRLHL